MDQTREMLSPDSLMDAEGDVGSNIGETSWPEIDPAETQEADVLCHREAIEGSQASRRASRATESCLPEHPAALTASQTGAKVDQASDKALASALEPELSGASPAAAAMTSTSDQEPEPRTNQPPSSLSRVVFATEPGGATNTQEGDFQPVARDIGLSRESLTIEEQTRANDELIADHQDDQGDGRVASTSSSGYVATTSPVPHTASHPRYASNESVTHRNIDLPSSRSEVEELSGSVIVDTNGGEAIVIDSSDKEMNMDNDKSRQTPRRRVQRKQVLPRSLEMVNWTSKEYGTRSAASLTAAWEKLAQILDRFHEKMSDIKRYELWNEKYWKHDGRRAHRAWVRYEIEKGVRAQLQIKEAEGLVRRLGRALRRLKEVEEEHWSIAVTMNDGDSEDSDYMPTPTRRHRKKRSPV
ncbi:hypothetical protein K458DRAFT_397691 [Lentithecium fluviatile CBS 122367]|uniref:Uncharacterized protein n=1 Tax=Lentithecium fluviatile CBS 122367 TaxID=1168545 RepID=A0A6G1IBW4_9PLEO|nr:hypothetical protein K458DRAFT_397691 [Lentithecium fluviatile CBS 122367]